MSDEQIVKRLEEMLKDLKEEEKEGYETMRKLKIANEKMKSLVVVICMLDKAEDRHTEIKRYFQLIES